MPKTKNWKKPVVITRAEAVNRLELMIVRIEEDVKIALWVEATLEGANDIVMASPNAKRPGAIAYDTVRQSLSLNLAMSLARLFDPGSKNWPANKRDIASIPLIIRLLKQKRCQRVLVERARLWTPEMPDLEDSHATGCRQSIDKAINSYDSLRRSASGRVMMSRLRDFRNKRLAHSMMQDTLKALPRYNELFALMDVARDIAECAKLAVDGINMCLKDTEEVYRSTADDFWRSAFNLSDDRAATASPGTSRHLGGGSGR